jgi:hypothetical protein
MDKKNLQVIVFVLVLVGVLVAGISFLIAKYEKESIPKAPAAVLQAVPAAENTGKVGPAPVPERSPESTPESDNQFPTEKGKFLL